MRFAIATMDRYLGVFEAFVQAGWTPLKLFAMPVSTDTDNHNAVTLFADRQRAAIQLSRITERDMMELRAQGCEVLVVACHRWHIGDWRPYLKYAVNFHSSPLPEGRGPYPLHRAILEQWKNWSVTCHRLALEYDSGDILAADSFALLSDESHESLNLKIQMSARRLATQVAGNFSQLWGRAIPQTVGSYWPKEKIQDRIIDFQLPVEHILRQIRAFGATETFALVNNVWLTVKNAMGWSEAHDRSKGEVAHIDQRTIVVAAVDGYIGLLDANMTQPHVVTELNKAFLTLGSLK